MHLGRARAAGRRSLPFVLLVGAVLSACQAVLGDFEVADVKPHPLGMACVPNSFRCVGARLERCQDDRNGFERYLTCDGENLCDPTAGACRACVPNQFACSDGELRTCGADGVWTNPVKCETAALCTVTTNRNVGSCTAPVCDAGSFSCQDGWLLACSAGRDRWDLVEYCGPADRCDAAAATADVAAGKRAHCASAACGGACPAATCTPGETRCSRDLPAVELCGTDGQWIVREACASRELCDATSGRCLPRACNLGDTRCFGQRRQTCAEDLTRFVDLETCPATGTCAPGGCEAAKCTDGTPRCNGISHETCVAGEYVPLNRCATRALCEDRELTVCLPGRDATVKRTCPAETTICDQRSGRCLQIP
jgi:hypothetical protein